MTLLTLVNKAQALLNLPVTTQVAASQNQVAKQLLALANVEGEELADLWSWQQLIREQSFTTTATETQTNATLPDDFGWIIDETMFNRTEQRQLNGPIGPLEYQYQKAFGVNAPPSSWRWRGNSLIFLPAPTAGQTVYYEYVSNEWCTDSGGGTRQSAWTADNDVSLLPERVMTLGLVWRFKQAKGFEYQNDYNTWLAAANRAAARAGGRRRMSVIGPSNSRRSRRGEGTIPEGSWS